MFKRIALALMFVSAFSMASLVMPETAEARRGWRRPYVSYYYGPPRYRHYYYGAPYRTYYRGWYGPRYYRPYYYPRYYGYYGYPGYYYSRPGVSFSIGF
jgi:hypothetical protein